MVPPGALAGLLQIPGGTELVIVLLVFLLLVVPFVLLTGAVAVYFVFLRGDDADDETAHDA